jgi:hypothetical protein
MGNSIEQSYINRLDRPSDSEITERGIMAEMAVTDFFNSGIEGFNARMSTVEEDSGLHDIGQRQTIDVVAYKNGRAVVGIQVTSAMDPTTQMEKLKGLKTQPFIRLPEMNTRDLAIPKTVVFLPHETTDEYMSDRDLTRHPEVAIQIIDGMIKSLQFDLTQTKNPQEITAVNSLISDLELQRKKYIF